MGIPRKNHKKPKSTEYYLLMYEYKYVPVVPLFLKIKDDHVAIFIYKGMAGRHEKLMWYSQWSNMSIGNGVMQCKI